MLFWGMILFVPASVLGARLGKGLLNRTPQEHFRQIVAAFLFIIGIRLLIRPA
jgi:uncharacterized membrane protein YfcA